MRTIGSILVTAIAIVALPHAAFGDALTAAQKASVRAGINNLVATVDMNSASEKPRLGKMKDGSLQFFGAPPNAPARLDNALKAGSAEQKAKGFLHQHAAAFGIKSPAVAFDVKRLKTANNRTFVRLQQKYGNLPVFCGETIVQLGGDGNVEAVISDIAHSTDDLDSGKVSLAPTVNVQAAEAAALAAAVAGYEARIGNTAANAATPDDRVQAFREDLTVLPGSELLIYDPSVVGNKGCSSHFTAVKRRFLGGCSVSTLNPTDVT